MLVSGRVGFEGSDAADRLRDTAPEASKAGHSRLEKAQYDDNAGFIASERQEQEMLMREQDEHLDELSQTVNRLGAVSLTIGQELEDQSNLLNDLDDDMDGVRARLAAIQVRWPLSLRTTRPRSCGWIRMTGVEAPDSVVREAGGGGGGAGAGACSARCRL